MSDITILKAIYASRNQGADVTSTVSALVGNGNDDIAATTANFGDPDPGARKVLTILYTKSDLNNGHPIVLGCANNDTVDLVPPPGESSPYYSTPLQTALPGSQLAVATVASAMYGSPKNGLDVTAICQALFNQGATFTVPPEPVDHLVLQPGTIQFGGDPDVGAEKWFAIEYTVTATGTTHCIGCEAFDGTNPLILPLT